MDILRCLLEQRGYVVVWDRADRIVGEWMPVRVQSPRRLIRLRYLRVVSETDREDYKAQSRILLAEFNKALRPLPSRLKFYRVMGKQDEQAASLDRWKSALTKVLTT